MTVAYDAFTALAESNTSPISGTHTPGGTPRGVKVHIVSSGTTDDPTAVTYGGVSMTEVSGSPIERTTGEDGRVSTWFLGASIPTGAQTVTATFPSTPHNKTRMYVITYTADADTEVVDTTAITGEAANPSDTVSLASRTCAVSMGFFSGHNWASVVTPLANWTSRDEHEFSGPTNDLCGCYTYDTIAAADVTMGWTQTSEDYCALGVAVSEVESTGAAPQIVTQLEHAARRL